VPIRHSDPVVDRRNGVTHNLKTICKTVLSTYSCQQPPLNLIALRIG